MFGPGGAAARVAEVERAVSECDVEFVMTDEWREWFARRGSGKGVAAWLSSGSRRAHHCMR